MFRALFWLFPSQGLLHGTPFKSSQNVFTCPFVVINLNDLGTIKNIGCRAVAHILGDEGWKQLFACLNFGIFNWPKWIYVPHSLSTRNLEADKAFITSWSGDIFQVRVQVRAPAGHLAIRLSGDNWSFWLPQSQWPSSCCCSALAHLPFCMVLSQSVHLEALLILAVLSVIGFASNFIRTRVPDSVTSAEMAHGQWLLQL